MTQFLEKFSQSTAGRRIFKVLIALTLMPAIILRAIVIDALSAQAESHLE